MLWIALHLPELPLQLAQRGRGPDASRPPSPASSTHAGEGGEDSDAAPCVIAEGPATRPVVCCANAAALAAGIYPGLPVAAARVLARELAVLRRDEAAEAQALRNLGGWAGQFTPNVALEAAALLLEVGTALRLHGGL